MKNLAAQSLHLQVLEPCAAKDLPERRPSGPGLWQLIFCGGVVLSTLEATSRASLPRAVAASGPLRGLWKACSASSAQPGCVRGALAPALGAPRLGLRVSAPLPPGPAALQAFVVGNRVEWWPWLHCRGAAGHQLTLFAFKLAIKLSRGTVRLEKPKECARALGLCLERGFR